MKRTLRRQDQRPALSLTRTYALAKHVIEARIWSWKARAPWLHAAVMASTLLRRSPILWRIYQAGIAAGLPSEFQKRRPQRSKRDALWSRIENAGRARVAASPTPLTLREAVIEVVRTPEGRAWYREYANARRR